MKVWHLEPNTVLTKTPVWMPPHDVLWSIQQERKERLERDYRFLYHQVTGLRPRGDWLDVLRWEITRWAAPAFVNKGTQIFGDNSTSLSLTYTGAIAGNWLVATVAASRFSGTQAAIGTPAGWSVAVAPVSNGAASGFGVATAQFIKENCPSGSNPASITGLPATSFSAGIISEYSGILTASSIDQATSNNGVNATATSGNCGTTGTTSQADEIAIACGHAEDGVGNTAAFANPSSGFTNIAVTATNAAHIAWASGYKILSAIATQTATLAWTTNSIWCGSIITAKGAGGGGGTFGRLVGGTLCGGLLTGGLLSGWM